MTCQTLCSSMMSAVFYLSFLVVVAMAAPRALLDATDSGVVDIEIKQSVQPFEDLHEAGTALTDDHEGSLKAYEVDDDEDGYHKTKSSKGNNGYKHYDSFHKKGGDKYGYESHSAHGMKKGGANNNGKENYYESAGSIKHYTPLKKSSQDHKPAGTDYSYSHYESEGDDGGHYTDEGDGDHFTDGEDGEHFEENDSDHFSADDHGDYGEGDSGAYHMEYESEPQSNAYNAAPPQSRATSYYIRHY